MINLELLFGMILLLITNNADSIAANDNNVASTSAELALKSIREAQLAGGDISDVSDLVKRFNIALDLMEQAERVKFDSCSSYIDCNNQAVAILLKLTEDAHLLKEQAAATASFQKLMNFSIYTPLITFATAIIGYCSFMAWKSHRAKKFLEMEIEVKEK